MSATRTYRDAGHRRAALHADRARRRWWARGRCPYCGLHPPLATATRCEGCAAELRRRARVVRGGR